MVDWRHRVLPDDPLLQHNTRGFVAFANTGPDKRSTQVYINTGDNTRLDKENAFAPFGQVVEGMDTVDKLYLGYGENAGASADDLRDAVTVLLTASKRVCRCLLTSLGGSMQCADLVRERASIAQQLMCPKGIAKSILLKTSCSLTAKG